MNISRQTTPADISAYIRSLNPGIESLDFMEDFLDDSQELHTRMGFSPDSPHTVEEINTQPFEYVPIEAWIVNSDIYFQTPETIESKSWSILQYEDDQPDTTEIDSSCIICTESTKNTIMIPCNHVCCCVKCAKPLKRCPICRTQLEDIQRVYI